MSRQTEYLKRKEKRHPDECNQSGCHNQRQEGHIYCKDCLFKRAGWAREQYRRKLYSMDKTVRVEVNPLAEIRGL